ncbi:MAG: hypothetical protein ACHP7K_11565, partial [Actinomycetales bacterium]
GSWTPAELPAAAAGAPVGPLVEAALTAVDGEFDAGTTAFLRRAAGDDQRQWDAEFGVAKDVSALGVERNVFRYLPVPVEVRLAGGGEPAELLRVVLAGHRAGARPGISAASEPPAALTRALGLLGLRAAVESDGDWAGRMSRLGAVRVRIVGPGSAAEDALYAASAGSPDIAVYAGPVLEAGRIEMLPFLHEQAVAITAHRFGNPDNISHTVFN